MNDCTRIEQELVDYLEGDLAEEQRVELESHVARCARCRDTLHSYRTIQDAYRAVPEVDVGSRVAVGILEAARRRPVARRRVRRALLVAAGLVVCASIAVLAARLHERPDPVAELVQRAEAQRAAGDEYGAVSAYEEALALAEDDERAAAILQPLTAMHIEQGLFEHALLTVSAAIERHPAFETRRDVLLLLAEVLAGGGWRDQAIDTYQRVARQFPEDRVEIERRVLALENSRSRDEMEDLQSLGYVGYGGE
jgi:tetratricopeptide (TPR) repeat protein